MPVTKEQIRQIISENNISRVAEILFDAIKANTIFYL